MSAQDITLRSELREDWALLQPLLWALLFFLATIGLIVVIRNIIHMYKETKK